MCCEFEVGSQRIAWCEAQARELRLARTQRHSQKQLVQTTVDLATSAMLGLSQ